MLVYVYTGIVYFSYFAFGLQDISSTTLLDVAEVTNASVADVTLGISIRYAGYCIGSPAFGFAYDRVSHHVGLTFALAGMAAAIFSVPSFPHLAAYWIAQSANGFMSAGIDIACYAWIISMWPNRTNPFLQGLFMATTAGSALSPLLVKPFLSYSQTLMLNKSVSKVFHSSRIWIPYSIVSLIFATASLILLVMYFWKPYLARRPESATILHSDTTDTPKPSACLVLASCLLIASNASTQVHLSSILPTFITLSGISKTTTASILAVAGVVAGLSMLTSTWISAMVRVRTLLFPCLSILLLSVFLLIFRSRTSADMVWVSACLMSVGFPPIIPSILSFVSQETSISNPMFGYMTLAKSIACVVTPAITGFLIEAHPNTFVYMNLASVSLTIILVLAIQLGTIRK